MKKNNHNYSYFSIFYGSETSLSTIPLSAIHLVGLLIFSFPLLFAQKNSCKSLKNHIDHSIRLKPIALKSTDLTVTIDRNNGLPYNFNCSNDSLWGEDSGKKINVIICRLKPRVYITIPVIPSLIRATPTRADLLFEASYKGKQAASFHLKYILENSSLFITMEVVIEHNGYELIEAALPNLATVREEDGGGWLAHSLGGGAVANLKDAKPYHLPDDEYFGRIGYVLPVAIIGTDKMECTMEVSAYMDGTEIEITGKNGSRHARIGTVQVYRVHGGRSYNVNDGNPPNKGNDKTPNLLVGQMSRCRLNFLKDQDGNGKVDWLDGAKVIAKRMPLIPTTYFNDKFIYLIGGKYKPEKEPRTTFAQSEKLIRDIAMLTDYAPQLALLGGWVYDGQDTGFPSEDSVNKSLGGFAALIHLMDLGSKFNANISFNTNYDDAYKSSPLFDTAFIARRPDGGIWRSRDWAGEYSYITGMAKYMKKWGIKRIDYMMDRYKIHDAILVDAMSWFAIRNDWDPENPASGYKNLVYGKYKIIDEFGKRGVNAISEQLRYPFIGKLAVSADGAGGGKCPFGGEQIPLLATIYRKSAIWGAGDFTKEEVQKNLFWNCRPMPWYINATDRDKIAGYYYLTVLPYNQVHDRNVESYEYNETRRIIGLGAGSKIEIDRVNPTNYSVVIDGQEIAGNEATYCPVDKDRLAFYSRNTKELSATLPTGWNAGEVVANSLFTDRREAFPVSVENGIIRVYVKAGVPVIVYRNKTIANKLHN